jgi:Family of unknown function (DUF6085)
VNPETEIVEECAAALSLLADFGLATKLAALLAERHHVIQFSDDGWIIAHPLRERVNGSLFDCSLKWTGGAPSIRGRFWLLDDGSLGGRYEEGAS